LLSLVLVTRLGVFDFTTGLQDGLREDGGQGDGERCEGRRRTGEEEGGRREGRRIGHGGRGRRREVGGRRRGKEKEGEGREGRRIGEGGGGGGRRKEKGEVGDTLTHDMPLGKHHIQSLLVQSFLLAVFSPPSSAVGSQWLPGVLPASWPPYADGALPPSAPATLPARCTHTLHLIGNQRCRKYESMCVQYVGGMEDKYPL